MSTEHNERPELVRFVARDRLADRVREPAPRAELILVDGDVPVIRIYDVIDSWGGYWGVSSTEVAAALDLIPEGTPVVEVHLNSPGGQATEGVAIANLLRQHPSQIVAVVDGLAASAASMIAMGADEVVMAPSSQMMIHDASGGAWGTAAFLEKQARALHHLSDMYAQAYAGKAGGDSAAWRELMLAETWYSPQEAVDAGLANRVLTAEQATDDPEAAVAKHDLRIFAYAGRQQAPAPAASTAPRTPAPPSASGSTNTAQEADMSLSDALRERLGIADENASEDTILAALDEALTEQADPPKNDGTPDPVALAEVTRLSTEVAELRAQAAQRTKDEHFTSWLRDGKTSPAERAELEALYDEAPERTIALVSARAKGSVVPVEQIGKNDGLELNDDDALFAQLFAPDSKVGA
jgi:ATP-dependent protease ClpP protease subunit